MNPELIIAEALATGAAVHERATLDIAGLGRRAWETHRLMEPWANGAMTAIVVIAALEMGVDELAAMLRAKAAALDILHERMKGDD